MTDTTAGRGGVGVRIFIEGEEVVRRGFAAIGDSGKKMWAEIAMGERSANPAIRGLSVGVTELRTGLDGLIGRAGPAGTALSAFGAAGALAAAGLGGLAIALVKVREGMEFAAALTDTAERIGVGAEALQAWRYVADEAGVSVETFEANLERLNGQVGAFKAGLGDGRLKPIFEELGITKSQLENVRSADEMMKLLADTLGQVEDRAIQVRLARGLGVEESLPILRLGSAEIARLSAEAETLGLVMKDSVRKELDEADRALEKAQQRIDMSMRVAVSGLADDFATLAEAVAGALTQLNRFLDKFSEQKDRLRMIYGDDFMSALGRADAPGVFRSVVDGVRSGRVFAMNEAYQNGSGDSDDPALVRQRMAAEDMANPRASGGSFRLQGHSSGGGGSNAAARQAAREAEQRRQRTERAADQLGRLQDEQARTYGRNGLSIDERAERELAALERERVNRLGEIARAEEEYLRSNGLRGLTKAEADQQRLAQEQLKVQKAEIVDAERRRDLEAERLKQSDQATEAAIALMDLDAQLTTSRRERVAIERRILQATIKAERARLMGQVDNDPNLTDAQRRRRLGDFDWAANRRIDLFDHAESERLRQQFKGYGREVVQAINDGRIGEYIGDQLKARLLDGALDSLFDLMRGTGRGGGVGGWLSSAGDILGGLFGFGGGRAGGGSVRAGFRYDLGEHGRPELLMLGGQGQVTDAAATARMLRESLGSVGPGVGRGDVNVTLPAIVLNAPGADAAALGRLESRVEQLRQAMPGMAIDAINEAVERSHGQWP